MTRSQSGTQPSNHSWRYFWERKVSRRRAPAKHPPWRDVKYMFRWFDVMFGHYTQWILWAVRSWGWQEESGLLPWEGLQEVPAWTWHHSEEEMLQSFGRDLRGKYSWEWSGYREAWQRANSAELLLQGHLRASCGEFRPSFPWARPPPPKRKTQIMQSRELAEQVEWSLVQIVRLRMIRQCTSLWIRPPSRTMGRRRSQRSGLTVWAGHRTKASIAKGGGLRARAESQKPQPERWKREIEGVCQESADSKGSTWSPTKEELACSTSYLP